MLTTQIDLVFNNFSSLLYRLFKRTGHLSFYLSALVFNILVAVIAALYEYLSASISQEFFIDLLYNTLETYVIVAAAHFLTQKVNTFLSESLLPALKSKKDKENWGNFISLLNNRFLPWIVGIPYGAFFVFRRPESPLSGGEMLFALPQDILTGLALVYLFGVISIPFKIRGYSIHLFANDPKASSFLAELDEFLDILFWTLVGIGIVILLSTQIIPQKTSIFTNRYLILQIWGPIIVIFLARYFSIGTIIRRAKQEKLNEIQGRILTLEKDGHLEEKEDMEKILRLWDYHNRVKDSRNHAFDAKEIRAFFYTLLLPLVITIMSNLESFIALLKQPAP
jgi:hypothetical protein